MNCGQQDCQYNLPHFHSVSVVRRGAETKETHLVIPSGQRGLRCILCDRPSKISSVCIDCRTGFSREIRQRRGDMY